MLLVLLTNFTTIFAQKYVEYYFRLPYENDKMVKVLNDLCSVDKVEDKFVFAYANPKEFSQVILTFPNYELLINPSQEFPISVAKTTDEMRDWDSYPSYSTYISMMNQFATDYPNLCTIENIGTSVDNRDILVAKISDNVSIEEAEPKFFYSGQMHGDEIVCSVLFLHLIDYLLENYGNDQEITDIINNTQIYINPLSNPDGLYTDNDDTINGAVRYNANGVDLNRNYPSANGSTNPDGNQTQVENIAMMNFANNHRFVMSANSHSGEVVVNYPWDTWPRLHTDDDWFQYVSRIYADTVHEYAPSPYMTDFEDGITNGFAWYVAIGSRQDWFNYYRNCREITLELSFNKTVPANQLAAHWTYNYQAMIEWLKEVQYGIRGFITDNSGNPLEAKIEIVDHEEDNSFVFSSPLLGDYYRPIIAGVYNLKVSAPGYETMIIENITVENAASTEVNVTLNQAVLTSIEGNVTDTDSNPIANASISLIGSSSYTANTDNNGYFAIDNLYSGQYTISLSAQGYQTLVDNILITSNTETLVYELNESQAISFEVELSDDWSSTSNNPWERATDQAYEGNYSLKSGIVGHNSNSNIQISMENEQSIISFYYRVSSEEGYDFLHFYINGEEEGSWSGEIGWTYVEFPVNQGNNTFKWVYEKDEYVQEGSDCAWIDLVELPTITSNNPSDVDEINLSLKCYPNPFNPQVNIRYYQKAQQLVENISIYNLKGQKVTIFNNLSQTEGYHTLTWNGLDLKNNKVSSGIYFVILDAGKEKITRKVLLMK